MAAEEPFRIFFLLGILAGISGVSLWPLYYFHIHDFSPGVMHARLMIEGFITAFIIGFLGTAAPRLTSTRTFSRGELSVLVVLFLALVGTQIAQHPLAGDVIYLVLMLVFISRLASRFASRAELPPPGFVLVALGLLSAVAGVSLMIINGFLGGTLPRCEVFGTLLLYEGFPILPVLGVGSFLLPRFLRLPQQVLAETRDFSPEWIKHALFALFAGVIFLATLAMDTWLEMPRLVAGIRFLAAAFFLFTCVPIHKQRAAFTLEHCLRLALLLLMLGLAFPIFWPMRFVAGLHVIFIGGLSLITLTVGTRVVLGHCGFQQCIKKRLLFLLILAAAVIAATILRILGDFLFGVRSDLLICASLIWIAGVIIWGVCVLPKIRFQEPEL